MKEHEELTPVAPLSIEDLLDGRISRSQLRSDGTYLYWVESRPGAGSGPCLARAGLDSSPEAVLPAGVSPASRVYGYGGGSYCIVPRDSGMSQASLVAFVRDIDQEVSVFDPIDQSTVLLSRAPSGNQGRSYGDLVSTSDGRWILAVCEAARSGGTPSSRSIVALDRSSPGHVVELVNTSGFLSSVRISDDGTSIVWTTWRSTTMSWISSELWGATVSTKRGEFELRDHCHIDGGSGVSVGQPTWHSDGSLIYISDAAGWWQPWQWRKTDGRKDRLCDVAAEFHSPEWTLGQRTMNELGPGELICKVRQDTRDYLGILDMSSGTLSRLEQPCVTISAVCRHGDGVAWLGSTPTEPSAPWWMTLGERSNKPMSASKTDQRQIPVSLTKDVDGRCPIRVSVAERFCFDTPSQRVVSGLFYPPTSPRHISAEREKSPLIVFCHGGPTGAVEAGLDLSVQFFTSRGYAVAAIDYGGSSGYGRVYRDHLEHGWGIIDVDDCTRAARYLQMHGYVEPGRAAIRGTSAGGFTALNALASSDVFRGAVSWYGVADLMELSATTHEFEAHYNDWLIGPLPESRDEYLKRSPIERVSQMHGSVLLIQGSMDSVVPPEQARRMMDRLRECEVDCSYLEFENEGHGFRDSHSIEAALEAELAFYDRILDHS